MSIHHEITDLESALTVVRSVHEKGYCEVATSWPLAKPHPIIGDVFAIHSEGHEVRTLLWVRNVEIGPSDAETKTCRLTISVGVRCPKRPEY